MQTGDSTLLAGVIALAQKAGEKILEIYRKDFTTDRKADGTPVTVADTAAEAIILPELRALTPNIPAIAEESVAAHGAVPVSGNTFWLVDPLDGTREFVKRNDEFSVNIGLVINGTPALGVIHGPAVGTTYAAYGPGTAIVTKSGLEQSRPAQPRTHSAEALVALISRSHNIGDQLQKYLLDLPVVEKIPCGSALKFGLLADGQADLYPRFGPTYEWDTAAGHAIILAVGGHLRGWDDTPWRYNKKEFLNPGFLAFVGPPPAPRPREFSTQLA